MICSAYQATAVAASPGAASDSSGEQRYTHSLHSRTEKVTADGCSGGGLVREQRGRAAGAAAGPGIGYSGAQ